MTCTCTCELIRFFPCAMYQGWPCYLYDSCQQFDESLCKSRLRATISCSAETYTALPLATLGGFGTLFDVTQGIHQVLVLALTLSASSE